MGGLQEEIKQLLVRNGMGITDVTSWQRNSPDDFLEALFNLMVSLRT